MADATTGSPTRFDGFVPKRAPIDFYGNGGFRFAGMSHRGSILVLADGIHIWSFDGGGGTSGWTAALSALLPKLTPIDFLLVGTGRQQVFPDRAVTRAFSERSIGLDVMDTGSACRTYNILLGENRPVMAALIGVL